FPAVASETITPGRSGGLVVGDFNGDQLVDFVTTGPQGGPDSGLQAFINDGAGSFTSRAFALGTGWNTFDPVLVAGDVDGDGDLDIVTIDAQEVVESLSFQTAVVFENDGTGLFVQRDIPIGSVVPTSLGLADVDLDSQDEIIIGTRPLGSLAGNNLIVFDVMPTAIVAIGSAVTNGMSEDIEAADFDGDGDEDLAVGFRDPGRATQIFVNDNGVLVPGSRIAHDFTDDIDLADFDGDGDIDIAVAEINTFRSVLILLNDGNANLMESVRINVGRSVTAIAVGDWGGSSAPDIVVSDRSDRGLTLFINQTPTDPPGMFSGIAPLDGASNLALPASFAGWSSDAMLPALRWGNASGFQVVYDVVIATDSGLTQPVFTATDLPQSEAALPVGILAADTEYFWSVTARNPAGEQIIADGPLSFQTTTQAPSCRADFNGDAAIDAFDIFDLLDEIAIGCD
ncbi:MAG: FG-GAP-like repeat-containing protein, partial [Planctomycetota bacterium]